MNTFKQLLAKPKIAIPASIIIVALLTVFAYGRIGVAPAVPSTVGLSSSQSAVVSGGNVSLSFAKSGRVESVLVKEGDAVRAGQVLAKLSAPDAEGAVAQAKGALDLAQAPVRLSQLAVQDGEGAAGSHGGQCLQDHGIGFARRRAEPSGPEHADNFRHLCLRHGRLVQIEAV
ncbi:MAG: biotin/lipoyl-binding protein [bacterium]